MPPTSSPSSSASTIFACLLGLAFVAPLSGCDGPSTASDSQTTAVPPQGEAAAGPGPGALGAKSDDLLARARDSMHAGKLAPELQAQIMASDAPEHARARRILRAIENESDRPAVAPLSAGAQSGTKQAAANADPNSQPVSERPVVKVVAPPKGSPAPEDTKTKTGPQNNSAAKPSGASTASKRSGSEQEAPRLAMLTRLRLSAKGNTATLRLNAADRVVMGVAQQPASGIVRLVIESAGALPGFLQARPSVEGVKVIDVRRGEDTVQISVELAPGWEARGPRSGADGASIEFVKR